METEATGSGMAGITGDIVTAVQLLGIAGFAGVVGGLVAAGFLSLTGLLPITIRIARR